MSGKKDPQLPTKDSRGVGSLLQMQEICRPKFEKKQVVAITALQFVSVQTCFFDKQGKNGQNPLCFHALPIKFNRTGVFFDTLHGIDNRYWLPTAHKMKILD